MYNPSLLYSPQCALATFLALLPALDGIPWRSTFACIGFGSEGERKKNFGFSDDQSTVN